jgi:glycosyltransferase involved in cell wall biosynthesis
VTEFVAVSEELARWLREELRVTQPVSVVKSLLPLARDVDDDALPEGLTSSLADYTRRARRVCSVGAFIPEYGFLHAAEAVEHLRRETGEDVGLLLLDGDFASDESYRQAVLRGRPWVTVLKNVAHAEVFKILKCCDAFVRGFGLESYGLSRVEAIWCGLPVVATRAGETRGLLLYDFGDVDALTRQLRSALDDDHARETAGWAATYAREAEEKLKAVAAKLGVG